MQLLYAGGWLCTMTYCTYQLCDRLKRHVEVSTLFDLHTSHVMDPSVLHTSNVIDESALHTSHVMYESVMLRTVSYLTLYTREL